MTVQQQLLFIPVLLTLCATTPAVADQVALVSVADNTLIEGTPANLSLGAAYNFYAGRVGDNGEGLLRRGLLRFDIASSIPVGSTIVSVTVRLNVSQTQPGTFTVSLHRALSSWGEGASFAFGGGGAIAIAPDATWTHRFWPDVLWTTPGGQFTAAASAAKPIGGVGGYNWTTTAALVSDVQSWVDQPSTNHGWCVVGNETTLQSAKRFDAHENAANKPLLTVVYTPPALRPADVNGDGIVDSADLGVLLAGWWTSDPAGDGDNNGVVNATDLSLVLGDWG